MKTVSVIGHYAVGLDYLDGQTIKTKIITSELCRALGEKNVVQFDTHGGVKTLIKAPLFVFKSLQKAKNVVILPAHNGLRIFGRLLPFFRCFFRNRKIHYIVIGGWLPEFLLKKKRLAKALKKFDGIYVETSTMKSALGKQNFRNVFVMPNSKRLKVLSKKDLIYPQGSTYKLCTFSRVMREKGIEDAVNAVLTVNDELGHHAFSLDIYGQVKEEQKGWFDELQKKFPSYIRYGGAIPSDESVNVLKEYFALLFPTYYEGEGFAGTLIDAYSAGVPVIASDWKYNVELVNEKVGYVYPTGAQSTLVNILKRIADNPEMLLEKKQRCLEEAEKYNIDNVIQIIINQLAID